MKRLSKIDSIEFKENFVLINEFSLDIDANIIQWLKKHSEIDYTVENYIERSPHRKEINLKGIDGIGIYTKGEEIERITVYPYLPNDSRNRFEGEIIVFGKVLPKPFLSGDIEKYFPEIEIAKLPKGYWERFKAWEFIDYPLNEFSKIEISMNRSPKYVGALSFKKVLPATPPKS